MRVSPLIMAGAFATRVSLCLFTYALEGGRQTLSVR